MCCANIGRSESAPLRIVPERGKVGEDDFKPFCAEGCDVLNEDQSRLNFGDDSEVLLPEPASRTCDSGLLSGNADVLAREAARDDVHQSAKRLSVEGGNIRPNRRWIQVCFVHARRKDFTGIGFPLHESDNATTSSPEGEFDSHVEPPRSAEKADAIELGRIHIHATSHGTRRPAASYFVFTALLQFLMSAGSAFTFTSGTNFRISEIMMSACL